MFEELSMTKINLSRPILKGNYLDRINPRYSNIKAFEASFHISGKELNVLFPPLSLINIRDEDYIYIQSFSYLEVDGDYFTERESYDSYLLLYTYSGQGRLIYENKEYILNPGEGFLIDCNKHNYYATSGDHWYHSDLHLFGGNSARIYKEFQDYNIVKFSCHNTDLFLQHLNKPLKYFCQHMDHRFFLIDSALSDLLRFIIVNCTDTTENIPEIYRYLAKYIESNYSKPLTLDSLASFAGFSKYYLARGFKKYIGYSPMDYVIRIRINYARFYLKNTDIPAYQIGKMVGIEDENNFIRLFKQHTGMSPGRYRSSDLNE